MRSRIPVACIALLVAGPALGQEGWARLIDADSIASWTVEGESKADFRIENGVVIGQPIGNNPKNSFLCSPREYADFELTFAFRIEPASLNSGVQFRSRVGQDGIVAGPQLEMDIAAPSDLGFAQRWVFPVLVRFSSSPWRPRYWPTAGVYGEGLPTGWIFPGEAGGGDADAFAEQGERLTQRDNWNEMKLEAIGSRVRTWLNGELRAHYTHEPTGGPGLICLQVHGGDYDDPSAYKIEWRDLLIRER